MLLSNMDALKTAWRQIRRRFSKAGNKHDVNENNLSSDKKIIKMTMIKEKEKLTIDVEYKIRGMRYSEEIEEEIIYIYIKILMNLSFITSIAVSITTEVKNQDLK